MSKFLSIFSAIALSVGLSGPAGATEFANSDQIEQRISALSEECQVAAATGINLQDCEEQIFIVSFDSQRSQNFAEYYEAESLTYSLDLTTTSAFELNSVELSNIARTPGVVQISENIKLSIEGTQNSAPWHLDRLDQAALPLNNTYTFQDAERGQGVRVYVVDTGVSITHNEFTGRIPTGYSAIGATTDYNDCNGHGTHVAALAAGTVTGAAKLAEIIPVRVLGCDGSGSLLGVLQGLDWIADNTFVGQPAVVNMSLGGDVNSFLDNAVASLSAQGLVFVVAAGNSAANACNVSPARVPAAITVAASTQTDGWATYSNSGSCVDVIAPGSDLLSAWIGNNNTGAISSGTSMAAGVVSGIVATQMSYGHQTPLALSQALVNRGRSSVISSVPAGTANVLVSNSVAFSAPGTTQTNSDLGNVAPPATNDTVSIDPVPAPGGGGGTPTPTAPAVIAKPTAQLDGSNAIISWLLPIDNGSPIISQTLQVYTGTTLINTLTATASATSYVLTALTPGVAYKVRIAATNAVGTAAFSEYSDSFGLNVANPINGPSGGEFKAWMKRLNRTQAKFYAKFPQINQRIQFMHQIGNRRYVQRGFIRITSSNIDANGEYIGLTDGVYYVRTITLSPGRNRLQILVDGRQYGRIATYNR